MENPVVVVTGASSGIGRATALAFAAKGAKLVICARDGGALHQTDAACAEAGAGGVVAVEADVSRLDDIERLADRAVEAFGGFDVWVNNAGVIAFGRIDETPAEDHEQVIRTNLCGCLFGSRAAVRHFRKRGAGTLINVSSVVSHLGQSLSTAYTASKWGVTGLGQALRAELAGDGGRIRVCTVMPAFIDTPIFERAANYVGREPKPVSPVYGPERVAEAIVGLVARPQDEIVVGDAGRILQASHALLPETTNKALAAVLRAGQFGDRPRGPTSGNLHLPSRETRASGGWREQALATGERFDLALRGLALGALTLAGSLAAAGLLRERRRRAGP